MTEPTWSEVAVTALGPLCEAVGLQARSETRGATADARLWSGRYAAVLFWPSAGDQLSEDVGVAEAWFADFLASEEALRGARVLDGYLLLGLSAKVDDAGVALVREIELSTRICRKQVMWPEETGEWRRFDAVTVLGLPPGVTSAEGEPAWPKHGAAASALWAEIQEHGAPQAAQLEARRP
ncbi:MAG: hypothetical protein DI570_02650 [Phenylobacterium zucineum]|nr:MAG: hypothetical protein DI570_02650 [Phenylobacterium zucineum]